MSVGEPGGDDLVVVAVETAPDEEARAVVQGRRGERELAAGGGFGEGLRLRPAQAVPGGVAHGVRLPIPALEPDQPRELAGARCQRDGVLARAVFFAGRRGIGQRVGAALVEQGEEEVGPRRGCRAAARRRHESAQKGPAAQGKELFDAHRRRQDDTAFDPGSRETEVAVGGAQSRRSGAPQAGFGNGRDRTGGGQKDERNRKAGVHDSAGS
jgi:hypothetical protein